MYVLKNFAKIAGENLREGYTTIFDTLTDGFTDPALADLILIDDDDVIINVAHCIIEWWRRTNDYQMQVSTRMIYLYIQLVIDHRLPSAQ
jgi:hypothetical protein